MICGVHCGDANGKPPLPLTWPFSELTGKAALVQGRFELGLFQSFKACMRRDMTLMWRNRVR